MSPTPLPLAPDGRHALARLARFAVLSCTLALGACAALPSPNVHSDARTVSYYAGEHAMDGPAGQRLGKVWWTLHSW